MAREWDLQRAQELCRNYAKRLFPLFDPLLTKAKGVIELLDTGAVATTGETEVRGATVIEIVPVKFGNFVVADAPRCLRAASYVVERALAESDIALRAGVTFVIDLRGVWSISYHITYTKMLILALQDQYPTKVGSVFILADSMFVQFSLAMFRWTLNPDFKAKIRTFKKPEQFDLEIDADQLTESFGGTIKHNARAWADRRLAAEGDRRAPDGLAKVQFTEAELAAARKMVAACKAYTGGRAGQLTGPQPMQALPAPAAVAGPAPQIPTATGQRPAEGTGASKRPSLTDAFRQAPAAAAGPATGGLLQASPNRRRPAASPAASAVETPLPASPIASPEPRTQGQAAVPRPPPTGGAGVVGAEASAVTPEPNTTVRAKGAAAGGGVSPCQASTETQRPLFAA